jgi:high affinity Mn2+ porin
MSKFFFPLVVRFSLNRITRLLACASAAIVIAAACSAFADDTMLTKAPPIPFTGPAYNWNGFYAGLHIGGAWGTSNWSTVGAAGSSSAYQTINTFDEAGSFLAGFQGGYNHVLPNRILVGGEVDASFPNFISLAGTTIGPSTNFTSTVFGPENFTEAVLASGTVRGRIGYAPGNWLFYATGGFAWSYDRQTLTNFTTTATESPFVWRLGWAAGVGVEAPIAPHWTAKLEYLFVDYGNRTYSFAAGAQPFTSDLLLQEVRAGVNYQFDNNAPVGRPLVTKAPLSADPDNVNFHGQYTFVWQGYPGFRSSIADGPLSLPRGGEGRETNDATLYAGLHLWKGAELWVNPEIDQGFGLADTHGAAGFPSGESYKLGAVDPYARVQRYFVRQTIDLGGATQKLDADINQFATSTTENRLVLWVGKFAVVDVFDTNKYANNPKTDFLNWSLINAGTFDYAGDAWGYSYAAAAEWYQGRFTFRGGMFDLSATPAGGGMNAMAYGLDESFSQLQFVGEIEERHELWGQPGKLKLTAFLSHGRAGNFQDAVTAAATLGNPNFGNPSNALAADRSYRDRTGVSLNLEQQINETLGVFARAGWADGTIEPWDFTDVDRTVQAGASIGGKRWGRPDDTIGIAGVLNGLAPAHISYFAAGGTGILVGDGSLTNYGIEQIIEAYYSYAITATTKVSFDYQFIANPAYNADRGPVNVFAGRFHTAF